MPKTEFVYIPQVGKGILMVEGPYIAAIAGHFIIDMVSKGIKQRIDFQAEDMNGGSKRKIRFTENNFVFVVEIDLEKKPQIICSALDMDKNYEPHNLGGYNLSGFTEVASTILSKLGINGANEHYELAMSL